MFEWIQSIDFQILDFIQNSIKCAFLDPIMVAISYIGHWGAIWILLGIVLLFFRKTRAAGVCVLASVALGFLLGEGVIKHIVNRPRPFYENTSITLLIKAPSGSSFPSGHSISSFAAATALLAMIKKKWVGICALVLATLIAFSRLYTYVHYPSDVICGAILGVICALIVVLIIKKTKLDKRLSGDLKYKSHSK